jgi:uncharacterized protein YhaN
MYIKSFNIDGFGIFHDFAQENLPANLVLFYGENEAGKSTLLAFLRTMFFGFSKGNQDINRYPPLRGGNSAGSLTLNLSDNSQWHLNRTFSGPKRAFEIISAGGEQKDEHALTDLFGGASKEMYRNVYAFSLKELQSLSLFQSEQVKAALYGATIGAGLKTLAQAEKDFDTRLTQLFGPRAQERDINVKLQEIAALREKLEELTGSTVQYSKLQEQIAALDKQLRAKETDHKEVDERIRQIERTLKQDSDSPAFKATQTAGSELELSGLTKQQALNIEAVLNLLTAARQQFTTLTEVTPQISQHDEQLATGFAELGGVWDHSRLEQVCAAEPKPQQVLVFEQKFTIHDGDRSHCERSLQAAASDLAIREEELNSVEEELQALGAEDEIEASPEQLDRLKSGSEKFASDARELKSLEANSNQLRERLSNSQELMKELLGSDDVSTGLLDLCNPDLLDSTQSALTIENLVNRGAIILIKDEVVRADNALSSAQDHLENVTDKLDETKRSAESLKREIDHMPILKEPAPQDVAEAVTANKGRLSQLFDQIESGTAELHQLNYELEEMQDLLQCSSSADSISRIDLQVLKQAGDLFNRESDSIKGQIQALSAQVDSTKHNIVRAGAKHQLLQTQLRAFAGLETAAAQLQEQLAAVQELRTVMRRARELHSKEESLTSRITDKQRSKEALESTAAENFAKRTKTIAICLGVAGFSTAAYLVWAHNALYQALGAIVLTALSVFFITRSANNATAAESAETFAKEITALEAELKPIHEEQKQLQSAVAKHCKALNLTSPLPPEKCETLEENLRSDSQNLARKGDLLRESAESEKEISRLGEEQSLKERELVRLYSTLDDARRPWDIILQTTGIQIAATPEEILPELSRLIEKAKEVLKREKVFESDQQTLKKVTELLLQCGVIAPQTEYKESWMKATDEWLKSNASAREKQNKISALEEKLAETRKQYEDIEKELAECQSKETAALAAQKQVRMSWQLWLIAAGLPTTLSCDKALSLADTISDIDELRSYLRSQNKMAVNFRQAVEQYRTLAAGVVAIGKKAYEVSAEELTGLATAAFELAEHRRARQSERNIVRERHTRLLEVIAELKNRRAALQRTLEGFLQDINQLRNEWRTWLLDHCLDAELKPETVSHMLPVLNSLVSIASERRQLKEKQTAAEQQLKEFAGTCTVIFEELQLGVAQLPEAFTTTCLLSRFLCQQLQREADAVALEVGGLGGDEGGEHLGLRHQIASLVAQRERLTQSQELQDTRQEMERLLKQLEDLSNDWARNAIAQHLLTLSKQRFEKDGQPQVVAIAGKLFKSMTNSTYTKVLPAPESPGDFLVENGKHARIATDYLSTGTQEQLYLALRMGFIKHRATQAEPLPVVMDDILVNFDERRTATAAQAILELADSHQVLYFTCHPMTVAIFKALKPDVHMVSLSPTATAEEAIQRLMDKFTLTLDKIGQRQVAD